MRPLVGCEVKLSCKTLTQLRNWKKGIIANDNAQKLESATTGSGLFCAN